VNVNELAVRSDGKIVVICECYVLFKSGHKHPASQLHADPGDAVSSSARYHGFGNKCMFPMRPSSRVRVTSGYLLPC
jgi:hypothetical protein